MFPACTAAQVRYMPFRDSVYFGEFFSWFPLSTALTNFYDLLFGKDRSWVIFPSLGVLIRTFCLSVFRYHVLNIVEICTQKQMRGVAANAIVATMQDVHTCRDWAIHQLPCNAMSSFGATIDRESSVAVIANTSCPVPTAIGIEFIYSFPEPLLDGLSIIVPANKTRFCRFQEMAASTFAKFWQWFGLVLFVSVNIEDWMTFQPATSTVSEVGNLGFFSTPTHTQPTGVRRGDFVFLVLMPKNISERLALYPSYARIVVWGEIGLLATTALAKAAGDFLGGFVRDMITHAVSSFQLISHSAGLFTQSPRSFYWVLLLQLYHKNITHTTAYPGGQHERA